LFDGSEEKRSVYVGFEASKIKYVGESKPEGEILAEGFHST